jgi:hypothetical protein
MISGELLSARGGTKWRTAAALVGRLWLAAEKAGGLTIERTGIVVNMPLVTWPGGKR